MNRLLIALLALISLLVACNNGGPSASVQTSHECTATECAVTVAISNPGNNECQISYDFTAIKSGAGVVGELEGNYSIAPGKSITLYETFTVTEKPNGMGVGTTITRGS